MICRAADVAGPETYFEDVPTMMGKPTLLDAKDLATILEAVEVARPALAKLQRAMDRCEADGIELTPDRLSRLNDRLDRFESALVETSQKLDTPGSEILATKRVVREQASRMVEGGEDPLRIRTVILEALEVLRLKLSEDEGDLLVSHIHAVLDEVLGDSPTSQGV